MFTPESIGAKIERADEHIECLNSEINALIDSDAYRTISKPIGDARESSIRIVGPEPPIRWAVIAGEVVHQLRSSLDHLICQLALANGKPILRSHQFPICDSPEKFKTARKAGRMKGLSSSAQSSIEARQPYNTSNDITGNFLYILREMDDADKHRNLSIVVALANARELIIGDASRPRPKEDSIVIEGLSPPPEPQKPTEGGTEVLRIRFGAPEPSVQVTGKPTIQVAFGGLGPMTEQPVIHVVRQLRDKTVNLISLFSAEFPG